MSENPQEPRYKDPKPDILRIEELARDVKTGDIKLPKFQRPFIWKKADILKLWDSIYRGYPIGSILLWLTDEKLASERKLGDLDIDERPDIYPTNYLLDGQQRLSSLCGGLYWEGTDKYSIWNIAFDVDAEEFLYPEEELKINYFPLNKLTSTSDFLTQCRTFDAHPQKDRFYQNAERLLTSIKDYKIAAVRIGKLNLSQVAPIFERINSSGRQLTMVDLMRAATWKGGFDLSDCIDTVRKSVESKNFEDVKEMHILRSVSASSGLGIHKEDIDKLRDKTPEELKQAAEKSIEAYKLAVDFLTTELPLTSISYLPYALQLTYIVEFFNLCPQPTFQQREELKRWFWETSITRHYGTANTGLITKDLAQIREFALGDIKKLSTGKEVKPETLIFDNFILNKASSLTFALLLASQKPKSFLDGSPVDTAKALAVINKLEYHHVFPKAYLFRKGYSKAKADMHANICMLNLFNNRTISDTEPEKYFQDIATKLGDKTSVVMESNFISEDAFKAGLEGNYEKFIEARKEMISEYIKKLLA